MKTDKSPTLNQVQVTSDGFISGIFYLTPSIDCIDVFYFYL